MKRLGQTGKRLGEPGIGGDRLRIEISRVGQAAFSRRLPPSQVQLVCATIDEPRGRTGAGRRRPQRHSQRLRDLLGDVGLDGEHILHVARELPGPDVGAVVGIDQFERDLHRVARRPH